MSQNQAPHQRPVLPLALSRWEVIGMLLTIAGLVALIVSFVTTWPGLPATVPTHFDIRGHADAYGSKNTLLILPIITVAIPMLVAVLARFPHTFNYPVTITPENAVHH